MRIVSFIKDNYPTIGLWLILFLVIWIQTLPQTESLLESTMFSIILLLTAFPFTTYLSETLLPKAVKSKNVFAFIFQFILFSVIIGFLFLGHLFLFSFLEDKGVFPKSEYFDMNVPVSMFFVPISAGIAINLSICGIRFFQENAKLKKTLIEYQLRTLQHQVTPHFMFNILNHIHILMQTDIELASDLLIRYSEILRYQLYQGDKQKVTLEQDIQFLKDFIAIEKVRWADKLTLKTSWNVDNDKIEIPALLFITLVENAFKHVSKSDFEKGYIHINFEQRGKILMMEIENSKSLFQIKKNNSRGLGMKNMRERLEILYYDRYDLQINETDSVYYAKLEINI